MSQVYKTIGDVVTLGLFLRKSGAGITGETPTVEIRRNNDELYFDWSAVGAPYWLSVGGMREQVLIERPWLQGYYTQAWNHSMYDNVKNDYTIIYRNLAPFKLTELEVIFFANQVESDVATLLNLNINDHDLVALAPDHFRHKVYDDNGRAGGTVIYESDISLNGNTEERTKVI